MKLLRLLTKIALLILAVFVYINSDLFKSTGYIIYFQAIFGIGKLELGKNLFIAFFIIYSINILIDIILLFIDWRKKHD